jgi:hypothetical protein
MTMTLLKNTVPLQTQHREARAYERRKVLRLIWLDNLPHLNAIEPGLALSEENE